MDSISNTELDAIQASNYGHATPITRRLCVELRTARRDLQKMLEETSDFVGHNLPWPHCYETERSTLAVIFFENMPELFEKLDAGHFFVAEHKFIFEELRMMAESGEPLADVAIATRWFTTPECKKRCRAAKVDHDGNLRSLAFLPAMGTGLNTYWSKVHVGRYMKILNEERLRRWLWRVSLDIRKRDLADPRNPVATLDWLHKQFDGAWANVFETHGEEINA